jgi:UDP-2,3-diacylglucosamine pyrophosphatase LpxH
MHTIKKKSSLFSSRFALTFILVLNTSSIFTKEKADTLTFINITDPHLIFSPCSYRSDWIQGRYNYFWDNSSPFELFFKSNPIIERADFVTITGDLVDFYDAETSEGEMMGTQIEQFQKLLSSVTNHNVYLTLGNHDITSYPKGSYHQYNAGTARAIWMKNMSVFANGTYYSRIYKVGATTYRLIFLDNAYFSRRTNKEQAAFIIDQPQLHWLEYQLNESSKDKEIIFMHMPLPLIKNKKEENIIDLSYEEYIERTNTADLLDVIKKSENSSLQIIVAGHTHINDIHQFDFSEELNFRQVLTGAFGNDTAYWRLFKLTDSEIIISEPGTTTYKNIIPLK